MDLSPNELRNDNKSIHLFMFMFRRALHLRLVELSSSMNEKANDDLQSPISSISFGRIRLAPSSGESCLSSLLVAINKLVVSLLESFCCLQKSLGKTLESRPEAWSVSASYKKQRPNQMNKRNPLESVFQLIFPDLRVSYSSWLPH